MSDNAIDKILECPTDSVLGEDLLDIAKTDLPFEKLKDASIMITGATGLVGSMLTMALAAINRVKGLNMTIIPLIRDENKARLVFGNLYDREDIDPAFGDITLPISYDKKIDYIIHGASVTASKVMVTKPVETIDTALWGTEQILKLAEFKKVKSMVYLSSMEAFGITDPSLESVKEEDLGYIDVMNVRSCYSEGKRMCELLCASFHSEYQVPVKIARLAQTFGAGVSKQEGRVFAQFAKAAMKGEDIVLHTKGESWGNYCYTADSVAGILTILLKGEDANVYTVANPETSIMIKDMAQMVADNFSEGKTKVVFDIPEDSKAFGYAPDVELHLNADKLMSLGWKPKYGLVKMYERMIKSFINQG